MSFSKMKFLVVDDSAMVRTHVTATLRKLGAIRVDEAADGDEAAKKIKKAAYDGAQYNLVTLDWEMPVLTGIELLKNLRSDPATKDIHVLMLTSIAEAEKIREAVNLRPDGYLIKPFTEALLEQKLLSLIQKG